ncbi:hypothetical protein [Nitrogeniibacter aestuarii]|uniref:hypothetical protein n=1 Tax=Nitrogeniibacter aestuarii TaxID=2815343 RepID=UPI001E5F3E96|nr:hypothetical protein [Nitrogeniibacter aestuarii]
MPEANTSPRPPLQRRLLPVIALAALLLPLTAGADNSWLRQLERGDVAGAIEGAAKAIGHGDKPDRRTDNPASRAPRPRTSGVEEGSRGDRRADRKQVRQEREAARQIRRGPVTLPEGPSANRRDRRR